ncbi:MAG: Ig-like domain-containing protein [Bdellovibrionia bacterium]
MNTKELNQQIKPKPSSVKLTHPPIATGLRSSPDSGPLHSGSSQRTPQPVPKLLQSFIACVSLSLALSGCFGDSQQRDGYTQVTIDGGSAHPKGSMRRQASPQNTSLLDRNSFEANSLIKLPGGLMVYFQGINGTDNSYGNYISDENSTTSFSIKNGSYRAFAFGYTSAGIINAGGASQIQCGMGTGSDGSNLIQLNGTEQTISFILNYAGCSAFNQFNTGNASNPIAPLQLSTCSKVDPSTFCASPSRAGTVKSAYVRLQTFSREGGAVQFNSDSLNAIPGMTVQSGCISLNSSSNSFFIPSGSSAHGFMTPVPFSIEGYTTLGCSGSTPGRYFIGPNLITTTTSIIGPNGSPPDLNGGIASALEPISSGPGTYSSLKLHLRDFSTEGIISPPAVTTPGASPYYSNLHSLPLTLSCLTGGTVSIVPNAPSGSTLSLSPAAPMTCPGTGLLTYSLTASGDGNYSVSFYQVDSSGNLSGSSSFQWMVSQTLPSGLAITSPAPLVQSPSPNSFTTATGSSLQIQGNNCQNGAVVYLYGPQNLTTTCSLGTFTFPSITQTTPGTYSYSLTQTDLYGNTSPSTPFTWIVSPPSVSPPALSAASPGTLITTPTNTLYSNSNSLNLSGTCEIGATVTLTLPPQVTLSSGSLSLSCATGSFSYNLTSTTDGSYSLSLTQEKNGGVSSATILTWSRNTIGPSPVTLNTPSPLSSTPSPNSYTSVLGSPITLSGVCQSNTQVSLFRGGSLLQSQTCNGGSNFTFYSINETEPGSYSYSLEQTDLFGNKSSPTPFNWSVTPPPVTLTSTSEKGALTVGITTVLSNTASLSIQGTCRIGSSVELSVVPAAIVSPAGAQSCATGNFSYTVSPSSDQIYTLSFTQFANGISSPSRSLNWDRNTTIPPSPSVSAPSPSSYSSSAGTSLTLTGTCQSGLTVWIYGAYNAQVSCLSSSFSFTLPNQSSVGSYTYQIKQKNSYGTASPSIPFTWNVTAASPQQILIQSGNNQTGAINTPLTDSFQVLIKDLYNNPVPSQGVTWAIIQGSGLLSPINSTTDSAGLASTRLTLGSTSGTYQVTATVPGLSPVTFSAQASAGIVCSPSAQTVLTSTSALNSQILHIEGSGASHFNWWSSSLGTPSSALPSVTSGSLTVSWNEVATGTSTYHVLPDGSASGCSFVVTKNQPPSISLVSPSLEALPAGKPYRISRIGSLSVEVSGSESDNHPLSYEWFLDETAAPPEYNSYQINFQPSTIQWVTLGAHTLSVRAFDGYEYSNPLQLPIFINAFSPACNDLFNSPISPDAKTCTLVGQSQIGDGEIINPNWDGPQSPSKVRISPSHVIADNQGNLIVADSASHVIWFWNRTGSLVNRWGMIIQPQQLKVIVGNGASGRTRDNAINTQAKLNSPSGLAYQSSTDDLFIADSGNNRVAKLSGADGKLSTVLGQKPDGGSTPTNSTTGNSNGSPGIQHYCEFPSDVKLINSDLYVACQGSHTIKKVNLNDTNYATTILVGALKNGKSYPSLADGPVAPSLMTSAESGTFAPSSLDTDSQGNLYWNDASNRIRVANLGSTSSLSLWGGSSLASTSPALPSISAVVGTLSINHLGTPMLSIPSGGGGGAGVTPSIGMRVIGPGLERNTTITSMTTSGVNTILELNPLIRANSFTSIGPIKIPLILQQTTSTPAVTGVYFSSTSSGEINSLSSGSIVQPIAYPGATLGTLSAEIIGAGRSIVTGSCQSFVVMFQKGGLATANTSGNDLTVTMSGVGLNLPSEIYLNASCTNTAISGVGSFTIPYAQISGKSFVQFSFQNLSGSGTLLSLSVSGAGLGTPRNQNFPVSSTVPSGTLSPFVNSYTNPSHLSQECLPILVRLSNSSGYLAKPQSSFSVKAIHNGIGSFYSDPSCGTQNSSLTFGTTEFEKIIYYKSTAIAAPNHTVSFVGTSNREFSSELGDHSFLLSNAGPFEIPVDRKSSISVKRNTATVELDGIFITRPIQNQILYLNHTSSAVNYGETIPSQRARVIFGTNSTSNPPVNGIGTAATLKFPRGIAQIESGLGSPALLVAEAGSFAVRSFDLGQFTTKTLLGSYQWRNGASLLGQPNVASPSAQLNTPGSLVFHPTQNRLYVSDSNNFAIRSIDLQTGLVNTEIGSHASGSTLTGISSNINVNQPRGLALAGSSSSLLIFADQSNTWDVSANNRCQIRVAKGTTSFSDSVLGMTVSDNNTAFLVGTDTTSCDSIGSTSQGSPITNNRYSGVPRLNAPEGVAYDSTTDTLYFSNQKDHCILKANSNGVSVFLGDCNENQSTTLQETDFGLSLWSPRLNRPTAILMDPLVPGNLWIADAPVRLTDNTTAFSRLLYVNTQPSNQSIAGLTIPARYDADHPSVTRIETVSTSSSEPQGQTPGSIWGIAAFENQVCYSAGDPKEGFIGPHQVRCIDRSTGSIQALIGSPESGGNNPRGGAALGVETAATPGNETLLNSPFGLAFDSDGNLYISESSSHLIRMVRRWW